MIRYLFRHIVWILTAITACLSTICLLFLGQSLVLFAAYMASHDSFEDARLFIDRQPYSCPLQEMHCQARCLLCNGCNCAALCM